MINVSAHPVAETMTLTEKLVIIVLLASLSEELLFRGFLLNMLSPLKSYSTSFLKINLNLAVILSGVLFGLMHFALLETGASFNFVIQIVISAMFLGVIAGYYQEKHNNFSYAFIIHMSGNFIGLLISFM
jgi:membrane protease YdiL (CAAX protease family)